jgi:autotransporter-associated beta strand protein
LGTPNGPLAIDAAISGSGNLELWGPNTVTLTAANTYTGNLKNWTTNGLILDPTGSLKFVPGATGVNNAISGTGPVTLNGSLNIDLAGAGSTIGDSWDFITTSGVLTIGPTFTVTGFSATGTVGTRIWRSGSYRYDESTGILSVSPNPDSDSDGMDDAWEATHFGDLGQDAAEDYDADGTNNLTEYRLGLIPNNGTSVFAATRNETTGQLTWPSREGVTFRIERSTTLGDWTALETALPAAASPATTTSYTDAAPPAGTAFYRIGLNP